MLEQFNMSKCKLDSTMLASHLKLTFDDCLKDEKEKEEIKKVPYASVGSS